MPEIIKWLLDVKRTNTKDAERDAYREASNLARKLRELGRTSEDGVFNDLIWVKKKGKGFFSIFLVQNDDDD